ncbi:MAG: DUF523 domain-containing protein [Clostridia bacterium]|nr:DUF523 domain-containing protein [Clostridia bacterium]MBQ9703471.1 DUF523 domain-containing protein [Clostridia bacterium]
MKLIVSKCLLGYPCRYDGKSVPSQAVIDLQNKYELVPVCPEELGGLLTPRIPAEIVGDRVIRKDGKDITLEYTSGAVAALEIARENNCTVAILKSKSPSCGKGKIYDGTFSGRLTDGDGICVSLFKENNIDIFTENETDKLK